MARLTTLKPTPRLRGRAGQEQRHRRMMRTNYMCEDCMKESRSIVSLATVVDHIIPLVKGGPDTDANTRNLCAEHNQKRTAEQFGFKQKVAYGPDGWPLD